MYKDEWIQLCAVSKAYCIPSYIIPLGANAQWSTSRWYKSAHLFDCQPWNCMSLEFIIAM